MSERRTPFQIQIELNEVLGQRIDLLDKWCSELLAVVKELSKRVAELEQGKN